MPLGASKSNFNYSLDTKRVLNMENVVDDSDNIKQVRQSPGSHMLHTPSTRLMCCSGASDLQLHPSTMTKCPCPTGHVD